MPMMFSKSSEEPQERVLKGVIQEEDEMPLDSMKNKNPSQNNAQKSEGQKVNGNERANQIINFILIMDRHAYVNGLEQLVKQIDGVDRVKGDCNSVRLEVTGKVDPFKVKEMVERVTKKKVKLIFPSAETGGDRDKNKGTEAKSKQIKTVHKNDIVNKKTEEKVTVLKIKLCCESCNQKLRKNLMTKGLDSVTLDTEKDLVEVKGTVDLTVLSTYIKTELKKDVEIVTPTEVKVPVKKGNGTTKEKESHAGDIDKEDEGAASINKGNEGTAVSEKCQDTGTANEKINTVDLKMDLHCFCDGCRDQIKKYILKFKGVNSVNRYNDLVTVKGTMNVQELISHLRKKWNVIEIQMIPFKKGNTEKDVINISEKNK